VLPIWFGKWWYFLVMSIFTEIVAKINFVTHDTLYALDGLDG